MEVRGSHGDCPNLNSIRLLDYVREGEGRCVGFAEDLFFKAMVVMGTMGAGGEPVLSLRFSPGDPGA